MIPVNRIAEGNGCAIAPEPTPSAPQSLMTSRPLRVM